MIFWQGMNIIGAILQVAAVFAVAICGLVVVISATAFVVCGVTKFWFDEDKDGVTGAQRSWNRIFDNQGWSKRSEDWLYEGEDGGEIERRSGAPPAQNVADFRRNTCQCRSCPVCDARKCGSCLSRKCATCPFSEK